MVVVVVKFEIRVYVGKNVGNLICPLKFLVTLTYIELQVLDTSQNISNIERSFCIA